MFVCQDNYKMVHTFLAYKEHAKDINPISGGGGELSPHPPVAPTLN